MLYHFLKVDFFVFYRRLYYHIPVKQYGTFSPQHSKIIHLRNLRRTGIWVRNRYTTTLPSRSFENEEQGQGLLQGSHGVRRRFTTTGPSRSFVKASFKAVLRGNGDLVGDEVSPVETHAELTNHGDVGAGLKSLHEGLRSRSSNGTQVVDQVSLRHTNPGIDESKRLLLLIRDDLDVKILSAVQLRRIRQGLITDLVQGVGGVRDQLTEKDFFVRVERVDDQGHQLGNLRLEGEGFDFRLHVF